ncbi:MarR family transcriptional regulator [Geodermatophilus sp. FMUSA9-8]|uniref:MarR family transcriptional regulator n=1 Tax=Geodermatophilus sp. FMUSA9-8 TaxID=3120155 RepID=UPI0030094F0B
MEADDVLLGLARALVGVSTRAAGELGTVSVVQLRALTVLRQRPDLALAALARGVGGGVSTTSRLVDRLVAAGWVDRRPSPASRRTVSLRLTAAGEDLVARYDALRLAELRAALDGVPPERRAAVLEALAEFTAGVGLDVVTAPVPRAPADDGGDPACWLARVCPACGRLADEDPPTRCPACGEELPAG